MPALVVGFFLWQGTFATATSNIGNNTATSQWEKRNIAQEIPVWDADVCVQCGKCVLVCPHAVIRSKVYDEAELDTAPETFKVANGTSFVN